MDHLVATGARAPSVLVVEDEARRIVGLLPILRQRFALGRDRRAGGFPIARFDVANVVGSVPLLAAGAPPVDDVIEGALDALPECQALYFDALPAGCAFSAAFVESAGRAARFLPHRLGSGQRAHALELSSSFQQYLEQRGARSRYKLARSGRLLEAKGAVAVECSRSPAELPAFWRAATRIHGRSWHREKSADLGGDAAWYRRVLGDFAERGWLRAYVLHCGGTPCAFAVGYQARAVYHYQEIAYDPAFAACSPGTVLLMRLLEHLFEFDRPDQLDFGVGVDAYKERFGTRAEPIISGLLFRATRPNALRVAAHELWLGARRALSGARDR
jgi:CelD/BcsL family acetyltransferase involved in cellulose biosynthesis